MKDKTFMIALGAALLMGVAVFLPWYSRNGVTVNGISPVIGGSDGWVVVFAAVAVAGLAFLKGKWPARGMLLASGLAFLIAFNAVWRGMNMGALGWGAMLMLLGTMGGLLASTLAVARSRS